VGLDSQLVSEYPATPDGQKKLCGNKTLVKESEYGLGFAYWGGEWISFKGNQAGRLYENQAFYDF
jgi:arabinogalactan endo-1,4-beta-galactosidase